MEKPKILFWKNREEVATSFLNICEDYCVDTIDSRSEPDAFEKYDIMIVDFTARSKNLNLEKSLNFLRSNYRTKDGRTIYLPCLAIVDMDCVDKIKVFEWGFSDYLPFPFCEQEALSRIRTYLHLVNAEKRIRLQHEVLNRQNGIMLEKERTMKSELKFGLKEIKRSRDLTLESLSLLARCRDTETGEHIKRTQFYVRVMLNDMVQNNTVSRFDIDPETIELLWVSTSLHDIGKVGIPDNILLKPGKLTKFEFETMKRHPLIGYNTLANAEEKIGGDSFLRVAREVALCHHERWDGSGYPNGLKGNDIPVSGRLMALADVYDALTTRRIYKEAFSEKEAFKIICEGEGKHFDPFLVSIFKKKRKVFERISCRFKDFNRPVVIGRQVL